MKATFLIFTLFSSIVFSQTVIAPFSPAGSERWGYINEKGEVIIEPTYHGTFDFSEDGIAPVFDDKTNKWSYINKDGVALNINLKAYEPHSIMGFGRKGFNGGFAVIVSSKLLGVINTKGEVVHPPKYNFISDFDNGIATAKIEKDFFILTGDGKSTPVTNVIEVKPFSEGLAPFRAKDKMYGFMDPSGAIVIPATFTSVGYFTNDLAWAKTGDNKIGFIDKSGKWVIEPKFDAAKEFDLVVGAARVKIGEDWMFVRKNGETFSATGATTFGDFSDGLAFARKGEQIGFIDGKGEWVIEAQFEKVRDFQSNYTAVRVNEMWGVIDKKGQWVCQPKFRDIKNFKRIP